MVGHNAGVRCVVVGHNAGVRCVVVGIMLE